ncbi:unnamed protein product [Chilo suppressalis]|uniref:Cuticle protein n=1 Tax=Chilo suppressalis TaxID=168631 RepID=A0ABN8L8M6_CHISP|nr:unnamed protein product [Chilo suppressalis]
MLQRRGFFTLLAVTYILHVQGADKYTDENRPYEFGFKIDGEQHRHEKKDENGLIMGEFGFITADGVYHVTVYATDENGNFKILSMKNIRVKPYPTGPERTGHSLPFPQSRNPPQTQGPISLEPQAIAGPSQASPAKSCSSCSIPTTTTRKPVLTDIAIVSNNQPNNPGFQEAVNQQYPLGSQPDNLSENDPQNYLNPNFSLGGPELNYPQISSGNEPNYPQNAVGATYPQDFPSRSSFPQDSDNNQNYPQGNDGSPQYTQQAGPGVAHAPDQTLQAPFGSSSGDRNPKQFTDYPQGTAGGQVLSVQGNQGSIGQYGPEGTQGSIGQFGTGGIGSGGFGPQGTDNGTGPFGSGGPQGGQGPNKPILISAQMQIVDKNTDIYKKNPGEKDGLPNGLTKNDMQQLLYTFNYTVGFHGHFEEGYTNGAKQGYYYVTARNGVRTRVDYVADENGFRPKITQEVLDLLSEDVPKAETEKDEKYGLKGYEFKWLYYPVESSS